MADRKPFFQHLELTDTPGIHVEADLDEECVDIKQTWHDMPIGQDASGEVISGDQVSVIRLSAAEMDALAKAWLRYRLNDEEQEGGA